MEVPRGLCLHEQDRSHIIGSQLRWMWQAEFILSWSLKWQRAPDIYQISASTASRWKWTKHDSDISLLDLAECPVLSLLIRATRLALYSYWLIPLKINFKKPEVAKPIKIRICILRIVRAAVCFSLYCLGFPSAQIFIHSKLPMKL